VFGPDRRVGLVQGEHVIDANAAHAAHLARISGGEVSGQAELAVPPELGDFIAAGDPALTAAAEAARHAEARQLPSASDGLVHRLAEVELHPPIASRARMFMAGNNYAAHAAGAAGTVSADDDAVARARREVREAGLRGFITFVENCVGPRGSIVHPARTDMLDFEGEVAVIIGREGKDVKAADALSMFWGFLLLNDVSARRAIPRADNPHSRFARDKNFDSSKCAGPYVVVGEVDDAQDIDWLTRVNGEIRQRGNTRDMIFSFAEMIEYLSEDLTLRPGDVVAGGTASGTIMDSTPLGPDGARDTSAFLQIGDVIEVSNPLLGTLRNQVVPKPGRT
jgi:acylpyruvate hydrolase